MAKPAGRTGLNALFEVTEHEREAFFERITTRKLEEYKPSPTNPLHIETTTVVEKDTEVVLPTVTETTTAAEGATEAEKGTVVETTTPRKAPGRSKKTTLVETTTVVKKDPAGKLRRARFAQEGHSSGEQVLYASLWAKAAIEVKDVSKLICIGWDRMAQVANLTPKNAKIACLRLVEKLSLEVVAPENSSQRQGRTYRIFSYDEILKRRRLAGMEWYIKTRGVTFVAAPLPTTVVETTTVSDSISVPETTTLRKKTTGTGVFSTADTVVVSTALPNRNLILGNIEESSSSSLSAVIQAIRHHEPACDDDAAAQIITECRKRAPDATDDEIVYFIRLKAQTPNVRMPLAFLKIAVPRCFEGESFRQFREEEQQRREREKAAQAVEVAQWRRILEDPSITEEERQIALQVIGDATGTPTP